MQNNNHRNSEDDKLDDLHNELKKKFAAKVLATKTPSVSTASDEDEVPKKDTARNDMRRSRRSSEFDKNHMRHRVKDDSTESSESEDDKLRRHWKSFANSYSYSSGYGMIPMQSMAFTSPYVDSFDKEKKSYESSDDSSSDECFEGYDNVDDGVEFYYKPKSTGRTEFTVTVEPKKQPWLPMMKCGFKPMVNCMAPPAYLIPPNCSNPPDPLHTRFQCIPPQYNDYQNQCCMMPCCGNGNYSPNAPAGNNNYMNNHASVHSQSSHTSHSSGSQSQATPLRGRTAVVSKIEDVSYKSQSSRHPSDSKSGLQMAHSNFASLAKTS